MIFQCTNCEKKLRLEDDKIKNDGTTVQCSACKHVFTVFPNTPDRQTQTPFFDKKRIPPIPDHLENSPVIIFAANSIAGQAVMNLLKSYKFDAKLFNNDISADTITELDSVIASAKKTGVQKPDSFVQQPDSVVQSDSFVQQPDSVVQPDAVFQPDFVVQPDAVVQIADAVIYPAEKKTTKVEKRKIVSQLPKGPIGLDIGTTNIINARNAGDQISVNTQLNAFVTVQKSPFVKNILLSNKVMFFKDNELFYIVGNSSQDFANMFNRNTKRPIKKGIINPKEKLGMKVLSLIINQLIPKSNNNETICFSTPGEPVDSNESVVYHESILKRYLIEMGYRPISINEGLATVMAELSSDNFTGIGISMGGGMCNVCLSYLSVPVITFSIQKGGDYIDTMVGESVNELATRIKMIKENELDLGVEPKGRIMTSLHIFYDDLIFKLLTNLQKIMGSAKQITMTKSIPLVLSGGTSLPPGFKERFEKALNNYSFPINISEVRLAASPLTTTAKGALVVAMSEKN
ncbi:Mad28-3 [Candidatus Magnetomoraceae bacterium gMMP-13]